MNVLVPSLIRRRFPGHVGLMTGVYTTALVAGGSLSAATTVPLRDAANGSLHVALGIWAIPIVVALVVWLPQRRHRALPAVAGGREAIRALGRSRVAWYVTLFMGLQSLLYYAPLSWLPAIHRDQGIDAATAGFLLSTLNVISIPTTFLAPVLAHRMRDQRPAVAGCVALTAIGLLGILLAPSGTALVWVVHPRARAGRRAQPRAADDRAAGGRRRHRGPPLEHGAGLRLPDRGDRAARDGAAARRDRELDDPARPARRALRGRAGRRAGGRRATAPSTRTRRSSAPGAPRQRRAGRRPSTTRTTTRAGRVGAPRERKSRSGPPCPQNGQAMTATGESGPASATGASQRGQASVPTPRRVERVRRSSWIWIRPPTPSASTGSGPSIPRWKLTPISLRRRVRRPGGRAARGCARRAARPSAGRDRRS